MLPHPPPPPPLPPVWDDSPSQCSPSEYIATYMDPSIQLGEGRQCRAKFLVLVKETTDIREIKNYVYGYRKRQKLPRGHVYPSFAARCVHFLSKNEWFSFIIKAPELFSNILIYVLILARKNKRESHVCRLL